MDQNKEIQQIKLSIQQLEDMSTPQFENMKENPNQAYLTYLQYQVDKNQTVLPQSIFSKFKNQFNDELEINEETPKKVNKMLEMSEKKEREKETSIERNS